jgi:hypothetical protein
MVGLLLGLGESPHCLAARSPSSPYPFQHHNNCAIAPKHLPVFEVTPSPSQVVRVSAGVVE